MIATKRLSIPFLLGVMLVRRIRPALFYPLIYGLLLLVGLKLTVDALRALL